MKMVIGEYSDLRDKKILVTGASSGIGTAVSLALAKQGAHLVLTGRDNARLSETAKEHPSFPRVSADLCVTEERNSLVDKIDTLDGICHCAGVSSPFPVKFLQEKQLSQVMDINFLAPSLLTSTLLHKKKINPGSSIVFISSIASSFGYKGGGAYSASKAALEAYSRNVAIEHASQGVRANCILPGMVRSPIYDDTAKLYGEKLMAEHNELYPLGVGEAADVASLVLFLLSQASRWMTGGSITLDGGLVAGK
jgi:NAD(P)-dependent dehydrogenase (short-subunit alcohol dehydrogenase family)